MGDRRRDDDRDRDPKRAQDRDRPGPGGEGQSDCVHNQGYRPRADEERAFDERQREAQLQAQHQQYGARGADPRDFGRDFGPQDDDRGDYGPGFYDRSDYQFGAHAGNQFYDREHGDERSRGWRDERDDYGGRELRPGEPRRIDRSWWDRARDEVNAWFGDEEAERRRRMDAAREGRYRDERRGDTGWSDPFHEPERRPDPRQDRTDRDNRRSRERGRWDRDRSR